MAFLLSQKKEDIYNCLSLYRELAYYITRREEYDRALKYFDKALVASPTDSRALLGRSWARAKVCQYTGALEDIAKILQREPDNLIAIGQKVLNTYLCCEFEDALVLNYRMVPIRKKPDNFTMGAMHCAEAIENSIGVRAGRPLRDHFKIIRRLAWKKARDAEKPFEPKTKNKKKKKKTPTKKKAALEPIIPNSRSTFAKIKEAENKKVVPIETEVTKLVEKYLETKIVTVDTDSVFMALSEDKQTETDELHIMDSLHTMKTESYYAPPPAKPFLYRPAQQYTTNIENYMAEKYLDNMYLDKIFLKKLKHNMGLKSPNRAGAKRLIQMSKEGHKILAYKQELLRTRSPFYFIKYQEATFSSKVTARMEAELKRIQDFAKKDADHLLIKLILAVNNKEAKLATDMAEKLKVFCDATPQSVLPLRMDYLEEMYKLVGLAYYQLFRINKHQPPWEQDKRVYNFLSLPCSREPSTDSVINQFKDVFVDRKKLIVLYQDRLREATTANEMAWIYHELCCHHTEAKQYELARVYARKCVTEATNANNVYWIINASMRLTKVNILQNNKNEANYELAEILEVAKKFGDADVVDYIERCQLALKRAEIADFAGANLLARREKQIIQMVASGQIKEEVAYLFKKMGVMPSTRRMSVMPGVRLEEEDKLTAQARKMSIMPQATKGDRTLASPKGKQPDHDSKSVKGLAFMDLIKYHVD